MDNQNKKPLLYALGGLLLGVVLTSSVFMLQSGSNLQGSLTNLKLSKTVTPTNIDLRIAPSALKTGTPSFELLALPSYWLGKKDTLVFKLNVKALNNVVSWNSSNKNTLTFKTDGSFSGSKTVACELKNAGKTLSSGIAKDGSLVFDFAGGGLNVSNLKTEGETIEVICDTYQAAAGGYTLTLSLMGATYNDGGLGQNVSYNFVRPIIGPTLTSAAT